TALRNDDTRLAERLFDQIAIGEIERRVELFCALVQLEVAPREVRGENRAVSFLREVVEQLMLAREQPSRANSHQHDARVVSVSCVAQNVAIAAFDLLDNRRLFHALEMRKRVAQLGGALEVERFRRQLHALAYATPDFGR